VNSFPVNYSMGESGFTKNRVFEMNKELKELKGEV
jgi:hypothetical protein